MFARVGWSQGGVQKVDFTDIDRSVAIGFSLAGKHRGGRHGEVGLAGVVRQISRSGKRYLAAGGLGGIIGDGQLPQPCESVQCQSKGALLACLPPALLKRHAAGGGSPRAGRQARTDAAPATRRRRPADHRRSRAPGRCLTGFHPAARHGLRRSHKCGMTFLLSRPMILCPQADLGDDSHGSGRPWLLW